MYSYVKEVGVPAFLAREAPAGLGALVLAEVFYRFGSFALECAAFLATWAALSWIHASLARR